MRLSRSAACQSCCATRTACGTGRAALRISRRAAGQACGAACVV
jgi:hypothetical protein